MNRFMDSFAEVSGWLQMGMMIGMLYLTIQIAKQFGAFAAWRTIWVTFSIGFLGMLESSILAVFLSYKYDPRWLQWMRGYLTPLQAATGLFGGMFLLRQLLKSRPLSAPIITAQIVMDWRGIIIDWNPEAEALLGHSPEDALRKDLADLIIPDSLMVPFGPEKEMIPAREAHRRGLKAFRETGRSELVNRYFQTGALHKDGRVIPISIHLSAHLRGQDMTFLGVILPPIDH